MLHQLRGHNRPNRLHGKVVREARRRIANVIAAGL